MNKKYVNLGCGLRYHEDWINIDFNSTSPKIISHNLLDPLPFQDEAIDVIYSSHLLEHFTRTEGRIILQNCFTKLKKGGIIRIVVPDLENICREYIDILQNINESENKEKYEWIVLELLDQMVRSVPGGDMVTHLKGIVKNNNKKLIDYIGQRSGENLIELYSEKELELSKRIKTINIYKIKKRFLKSYLYFIRLLLPKSIRTTLFDKTTAGEKHKWMYDKYSLSVLLNEIGFNEIKFYDAFTSSIPNFNDYCLDITEEGRAYKGTSIYCEGIK